MKITNERLLKAIFNFADFVNVTPPQSNDFGDWCNRAVNEMTERDVHLFFFAVQGALKSGLGSQKKVSIMFRELERRKLEIDPSFCAI